IGGQTVIETQWAFLRLAISRAQSFQSINNWQGMTIGEATGIDSDIGRSVPRVALALGCFRRSIPAGLSHYLT
ncbi:MAG TPA: hypothetical protein VNQ74_18145, partial [Burkholderiaceae bacterium]|nr:hypothetical protein [Burkholderiaceae bacterium]